MAIGKDNDLLWHLPSDLKMFKKLTTGHCLIMGRNTWFSLPKRPLPERIHIVLSDIEGEKLDGCTQVSSISEALEACPPDKEVFIIGGGSIYRQFIGIADRLIITHVNKSFDADTFFPEIEPEEWKEIEREDFTGDETVDFNWSVVKYLRIK